MAGGNRSGDSGGGISDISEYKNPKHLHNMVRDNVRAINSDANLQATSTTNEAGTQAGVRTKSSGTQREDWDTKVMPPELKRKMTEIFIKSVLAKIPVGSGKDGVPTADRIEDLPDIIARVLGDVNSVIFGGEEDSFETIDKYIEEVWRDQRGDIENTGMTLLGVIGANMVVGVDGDVKFDDSGIDESRKDGDQQIVITEDSLIDAIVQSLRSGNMDNVEDLVSRGMENGHIVAEGVQIKTGEAPLYYDIALNTRGEGESIFARPGKSYGARSELEKILKTETEFGGSGEALKTREEASGEQKTGSALPQRVEQLKSEKASSTAGSTTQPPSTTGTVSSSGTASTTRVEPSGKPDLQDNKK